MRNAINIAFMGKGGREREREGGRENEKKMLLLGEKRKKARKTFFGGCYGMPPISSFGDAGLYYFSCKECCLLMKQS